MAVITKNNHYRFGYDHVNNCQFRRPEDSNYTLEFGKCDRKVLPFYQEALATARLVKEHAGTQQIWLSCSGGIDSEFMARCFLQEGISFKVLNAKFKYGYNKYDQEHLYRFIQKYNLDCTTIEINIENFLDTELLAYADATQSVSPQFPVNMKLWDAVDGYIVSGHGDPIIRRVPYTKDFFLQVQEKEDAIFRYFLWRGRDGCPGFYNYTPEILLSFIMESEVSRMLLFGYNARVSHIAGTKEIVYSKSCDLAKREAATGFEHIQHLDSKYRTILLERHSQASSVFKIPVNKLVDQLWPDCMTTEGGAKYLP